MNFDWSTVTPPAVGSYVDLSCPTCGPEAERQVNRVRKVLRVWRVSSSRLSYNCVRCGAKGVSSIASPNTVRTTHKDTAIAGPAATLPPAQTMPPRNVHEREEKAKWLWRKSQPIAGTPAERYLREARAYGGPLPPTLRYLPASGAYSCAMIAYCGVCPETEPGVLEVGQDPAAVHLTLLAPDGSKRLEKRMIGPVSGRPIVLSAPNDGLGLAVTEGIEDGLSIYEASGLGVWAAGSAAHMAKLGSIVPRYIECVTLSQDANEAGRKACARLAHDLRARNLEVRILSIAQAPPP